MKFPFRFHLCITHMHTQEGVAEAFLRDVREEVAEIMKNPEDPVEGKVWCPKRCFCEFLIVYRNMIL